MKKKVKLLTYNTGFIQVPFALTQTLSGKEALILSYLIGKANLKEGNCVFVKYNELSKYVGESLSSCRIVMNKLELKGFLSINKKMGRNNNQYCLNIQNIQELITNFEKGKETAVGSSLPQETASHGNETASHGNETAVYGNETAEIGPTKRIDLKEDIIEDHIEDSTELLIMEKSLTSLLNNGTPFKLDSAFYNINELGGVQYCVITLRWDYLKVVDLYNQIEKRDWSRFLQHKNVDLDSYYALYMNDFAQSLEV
jgi:hypothetical protein